MTEFRDELNTMIRHTLAAITLGLTALTASAQGSPARPDHAYGKSVPIPDQYIVVFRDDTRDPRALAAQLAREQGGQVLFTYGSALKGFAARLSQQAVNALRRHPNVAYIEQDATVSLNATQSGATWGLDRVDQQALPLNSSYSYNTLASGVYAFIIDTGIRRTHVEFSGRVIAGFDAVSGGTLADDCNGHGTHVAGTVGGAVYGVAKGVTLVPVRVLGCTGSGAYSGVIAGVEFVANSSLRPAVANMSLGGGYYAPVNTAVANAVSKGVTMVVAAGNDNQDACNYSPASTPTAITVGATTSVDQRSSFSNYGTCVDLFAPGSSITSAWISRTSNTATNTISGTSMAAPHVAGAAALFLAANRGASPAEVAAALVSQASVDKVAGPGTGSPNLLLYTSSLFPSSYSLTVIKAGAERAVGLVTSSEASPTIYCGPDCNESFTGPTSVTLNAIAGTGANFGGWSGCTSSNGSTCTVSVDLDRTVTATFNTITNSLSVRLGKTVSKAAGTVTSSPAGINCSLSSSQTSRTCSANYNSGTSVTLTATAASGSIFTGWGGGLCTGTDTCIVTMDQARSVTATFSR